jgi:hypothetical protein
MKKKKLEKTNKQKKIIWSWVGSWRRICKKIFHIGTKKKCGEGVGGNINVKNNKMKLKRALRMHNKEVMNT